MTKVSRLVIPCFLLVAMVSHVAIAGWSVAPKGGTYKLRDPGTGQVRRTGRTNDLQRRRGEHARHPETRDMGDRDLADLAVVASVFFDK